MTRSIGPMWSLKTIPSLRPSAASRWSALSQVKGRGLDVAPFPSSAMSLGLGIPWQVALQQSLPPLSQPVPLCNSKTSSVEQFSADSTCLTRQRVSKFPAVQRLLGRIVVRRNFKDYDSPPMNVGQRRSRTTLDAG